MNPLIQLQKGAPVFVVTLVCAGLLPTLRAVSPAPDGGYPGGNTAEGQNALLNLTSGTYNTALGLLSLKSNTTGSYNTATGAGTLLANTADQNTATGFGALLSNTTGYLNTANGAFALFSNTTGIGNTANGTGALLNNAIGIGDTANGFQALQSNTIGEFNTAIGDVALRNNTSGNYNTAVGAGALGNSTGSDNIGLGHNAGTLVAAADNVIVIGSVGANLSNSCFIGNIRDAGVAADAEQIYIDSTGKLGTFLVSSRRFKKEIKPMDSASEAILGLKPVTFHYNSDDKDTPQFGLIAEEVAEVNPDLVVRDKNGEIYTVRYDAVNAMLLNEFLKEHKTVQEQGATIARLQKQIEALTAGLQLLSAQLKEQVAQIQKVSAQLEASKPAPQVVNNP